MTIMIVSLYDYYNSLRRYIMELKLFDSELKVMEHLWQKGDLTAGQLAKALHAQTGRKCNNRRQQR